MSTFVDDTTPLLPVNSQSNECIPMTAMKTKSLPIPVTSSTVPPAPNERLVSLDQYRGFVILCLIFVPLLGSLNTSPNVFKHNGNFFSIKDAIQPQFYIAIGFSMQMTLLRSRAENGIRGMLAKQFRRSRTLYIISLVLSGIDDQKSWDNLRHNWFKLPLQFIWCGRLFQTLAIISIAQLIILPVITRPAWVRICYMVGCMTLFMLGEWAFWLKYQFICYASSFEAVSWAFVMIAGTFLNDWNEWIRMVPASNVVARRRRVIKASVILLAMAGTSLLLGYLISSIPASWSPSCYTKAGQVVTCPNMSLPSIPFVAPQTDVVSIWTMSQWFPSFTIQLAGIGYSLLVYFFWFVVFDLYNFQFSFLNTLSAHSLLMYILSDYGATLASRVVPSNSPLFMLPVVLIIGGSTNVMIVRYLKAYNINLRL